MIQIMTRIKPKRVDNIRTAFDAVDKASVDRDDLDNQTKIQELDDKMNEKSFDGINGLNKINLGKINIISNKKMRLKTSKRY